MSKDNEGLSFNGCNLLFMLMSIRDNCVQMVFNFLS